ncbi:MAG: sodium:proton exchanger [Alphaproteobacteria bacterium]|nr:sodium:proton exchanger [Alphaproteobacteria bacterium]
MFDIFPVPVLVAVFLASAGIIWVAGVKLSDATDILADRFGFGEAMGGMILLAIATNLPEIAITASAAWHGDLGVAVGNILGGIAIQTVVLVILDAFMKDKRPLTYRAASLTLVIEGLLVIAVLIVAIAATQLPASLILLRLTPDSLLIALFWAAGIWLIARANRGLPWHDSSGSAPDTQTKPKGHSKSARPDFATHGTAKAVAIFAIGAAATLVAGLVIEESGSALAGHIGMSGVLFGATFLAAATALPELSTGLASTRLKDYQLAISDIFGGNAFLPVLFLLATVMSGKAVLPHAQATDIYLAALGILLTCVYTAGLIFRPGRRVLGIGIDSLAVLILYGIGIGGLVFVAQRGAGG